MQWEQVWTIVGANLVLAIGSIGAAITLFLWARHEAELDRRNAEDRTERLLKEMKDEMKDFHGRLCSIEEGRKS